MSRACRENFARGLFFWKALGPCRGQNCREKNGEVGGRRCPKAGLFGKMPPGHKNGEAGSTERRCKQKQKKQTEICHKSAQKEKYATNFLITLRETPRGTQKKRRRNRPAYWQKYQIFNGYFSHAAVGFSCLSRGRYDIINKVRAGRQSLLFLKKQGPGNHLTNRGGSGPC